MTIEDQPQSSKMTRGFFWSVLGLALLVAVLKRAWVIAPPGFPLGEGGLFILFSQTILNNGFALPDQILYGGATIPFAYPPAAFYVAAAVSQAIGADLFSVYYWLPLAFNILAVPAFCVLAAQLTNDRTVFLCASLLYVQIPESYIWQVTGGGLPRSLAALFALYAVALALRAASSGSKQWLLLSGLCIGFAILSHLEWGIFAAVGVTLAFLNRAQFRRAVLMTALAASISFIVIAPWLLAVVTRQGLDPFLSGASASAWNLGSSLSTVLRGRMFSFLVWPAIIGVLVTVRQRQWFLLSWLVLTVLLTPRMGASAGYGVPASLLAGYGFKAVGELACTLTATLRLPATGWLARHPWMNPNLLALAPLLLFSGLYATTIPGLYHRPDIIWQVNAGSREAMLWTRQNTDPRARFVVISGAEEWYLDRIAEWFPFLAGRRSLTTAQGLEWAGPGVFEKKTGEISGFKLAQAGAPELMSEFVRGRYCSANYVAVFTKADAAERRSFQRAAAFRPVFANKEAAIFRQQPIDPDCQAKASRKGILSGNARNIEAR